MKGQSLLLARIFYCKLLLHTLVAYERVFSKDTYV